MCQVYRKAPGLRAQMVQRGGVGEHTERKTGGYRLKMGSNRSVKPLVDREGR